MTDAYDLAVMVDRVIRLDQDPRTKTSRTASLYLAARRAELQARIAAILGQGRTAPASPADLHATDVYLAHLMDDQDSEPEDPVDGPA